MPNRLNRLLEIRAISTNTQQETQSDPHQSRVTQRTHHVTRHCPHHKPSPIWPGQLTTPEGAHVTMRDTTE